MSIKTEIYTDAQINDLVDTIISHMDADGWKPDYIVGLNRGGLVPSVYMSHKMDVPLETLGVSSRFHEEFETNCWMSEDAFGYDAEPLNILIVDDINNTGASFDWIINDWQSTCRPGDNRWDTVWGDNVRFAVLVDNLGSDFSRRVDYYGVQIDKRDDNTWLKFPWEK